MARRKKGGISKVAVGIITLVIIIGFIYTDSTYNLNILNSVFRQEGTVPLVPADENFWFDPAVFYFALGDFDGVHCWIHNELTQINKDGTQETLASKDETASFLSIVGGFATSAKEVNSVKLSPRLSCNDVGTKQHTMQLGGGTITTEFSVRDKLTNQEVSVEKKTTSISALNSNLNVKTGGGNKLLPTITTLASAFESKIIVPNTVASRNFDATGRVTGTVVVIIDGNQYQGANLLSGVGGTLKFINPNFSSGGTTTTKGTQVTITSISPTSHYYIGSSSVAPTGATSAQLVASNDQIVVTIKGTEDNWSSSEGLPIIQIKNSKGQTIATNIQLSTIKALTGGLTEFSRINFRLPVTINDQNIADLKGSWTVEMIQLGRVAKDVKTLQLVDARSSVVNPTPPVTPKCDPVTQTLVNGVCKPNTSPLPPAGCQTETEITANIKGATNDELISSYKALSTKSSTGVLLDKCELLSFQLITTEFNVRGIDPNETPATTPVGIVKANSYIRYLGKYAPDESSNHGCTEEGKIPDAGLPILGFQLFAVGGNCNGKRLGTIELVPTIDFGSGVSAVTIDSSTVTLGKTLFISKNNPYPNNPTFSCTGQSSVSIGTCTVSNHNYLSDGVSGISFAGGELTTINNFVDKPTSGEYALALATISEGGIKDKLAQKGVSLKAGDKASVMLVVWGKFTAVVNGQTKSGAIPPMTYVKNLQFLESDIDKQCDLTVSYLEQTCTKDASGVESCTEQCLANPTTPDRCNFPNKLVNGVCKPPDSDKCSEGQILDKITGLCREPVCPEVPMCQDDETYAVSTVLDDCQQPLLSCVKITDGNGGGGNGGNGGNGGGGTNTCSSIDQYRDRFGVCQPLSTEPCPSADEIRDRTDNICKKKGTEGGSEGGNGGGGGGNAGYCDSETYDFAKCFAQLFQPKAVSCEGLTGAELTTCEASQEKKPFQITGTTLLGVMIFVVVIIILIVITVIVRRRSGGGGIIG